MHQEKSLCTWGENFIIQEEFLSTVQVLHGDSELAIVATLVEVSRSRRRVSNILSDNINKHNH